MNGYRLPGTGITNPGKDILHSAEGIRNAAEGIHIPAKGIRNPAKGIYISAKGTRNPAKGIYIAAKGTRNPAKGIYIAAKGIYISAKGTRNAAKGTRNAAKGICSPAKGTRSPAKGIYNPAKGTMKKIFPLLPVFLIAVSCKVARPVADKKGERIESGVASWYGPGFHGKKTANGETFNTNALTAAHRTLPFDTQLRVLNVENGKSVNVRINDRGPYAKDRIIDLSKAAASRLDMIQAGTARVELFLLDRSADDLNMENIKKPTYAIQVASFSDQKRAQQKAGEFSDGRVKKVVVNRKNIYRVLVGKYHDAEAARKRNAALKARGVNGFVKQVEN